MVYLYISFKLCWLWNILPRAFVSEKNKRFLHCSHCDIINNYSDDLMQSVGVYKFLFVAKRLFHWEFLNCDTIEAQLTSINLLALWDHQWLKISNMPEVDQIYLSYDIYREFWLIRCEGYKKRQYNTRDHFVYAPRQWETTLQCNVVSHWQGACTEWSLHHTECSMLRDISLNLSDLSESRQVLDQQQYC